MDIDTVATLVGMLAGFVSVAAYLRHDTHRQVDHVREEVTVVRGDFKDLRGDFKDLRVEFKDVRGEFNDLRVEFKDLRGEIKDLRVEFNGLRGEFNDLRKEMKVDLQRLDDKIFALATGLRPLIEQAERTQPS